MEGLFWSTSTPTPILKSSFKEAKEDLVSAIVHIDRGEKAGSRKCPLLGLTWLSSGPPGGLGSLSGASSWASRTVASCAHVLGAVGPSHHTLGPVP